MFFSLRFSTPSLGDFIQSHLSPLSADLHVQEAPDISSRKALRHLSHNTLHAGNHSTQETCASKPSLPQGVSKPYAQLTKSETMELF